ncbi:MAG: hypothetical protein ACYDAC_11790 [Candidatus Dormibacteria bacterium]
MWHLEKRIALALGDEAAQQSLGALMTLAVSGQVDPLIAALAEHWAQETEYDERRARIGDVLQYVDANRTHLRHRRHHRRCARPRHCQHRGGVHA